MHLYLLEVKRDFALIEPEISWMCLGHALVELEVALIEPEFAAVELGIAVNVLLASLGRQWQLWLVKVDLTTTELELGDVELVRAGFDLVSVVHLQLALVLFVLESS